ncbi:class II fructose-bisphosphate aldolase [Cryobacterium sp. TMT1-66-1]|uniref:class II fructose-bisphosphate aldolase n=1 Tax=Cryobacterium sp. TMT1-66-1 TaxID=1259242 RepID=UPI00106B1ACA|nr:class II fructose-bisphosphate aldolase [Cryobacterium sp. TMT1-66-1]TFD08220.1 fructose-bisphosphate aldolase [Cryobacterium sp. TMT1-66-1]
MTLATTRELVAGAVNDKRAVLAFNVITLEHAEGIVAGVERANAQALLQVSENAVHFHGGQLAPILAACARLGVASTAPIAIHLDHFQDLALAERAMDQAAELGVSSIMIDASNLGYAQNVQRTLALAQRAHDLGLWVEAELGTIGGKDGAHTPGVRTDPGDARDFVRETSVDGLAVAVGSSHAMATQDARLDLDLIGTLAAKLPVPLVLHGSSGVDDSTLTSAIRAGIRKVNVGTALNVAFTREIRRFLQLNPEITDPRTYLAEGREAVARAVAHLCVVVDPEHQNGPMQ